MSTNSIQASNKKLSQSPLEFKNGSFSTNLGTGDSTNHPVINPIKVLSILSGLKAITHAYTDSEDRIIKLWKSHTFGYLAGVLDSQGHLEIIPNQKILNSINPSEASNIFLRRLENNHISKWDFVFDPLNKTVTIWPHLIAEGKWVDFEAGFIFTPEEAIARRYPYLKSFPHLVIMSGPSGSGKSTWIQSRLKDYQKISLDDLREQHGKRRSNQDHNSFILSKAKDQLKIHLRNHDKVVWDATNLRKDFRKVISQLGFDYHALVTLVVLHIPESNIHQGNQSRDYKVSREVLNSQLDLLEWVEDSEAHRIAYVNHKNCLDLRGRCDSISSHFW